MATDEEFNPSSALSKLTTNTTAEEIKDLYVRWAPKYEEDLDKFGYVSYLKCVGIFDAEMKRTFGENRHKKKVIDAASGTGILGRTLKDHGYTDVDALDICPGMLNESRDKGIYKNLICAAICDQRIDEIETGSYDGLTCSAALTVGHIKPQGLNEIVRLVKPGGVICFSILVDDHDGQGFGYKEKMDELSTAGMWEFKEKTEPVKEWKTCYILVYKRL